MHARRTLALISITRVARPVVQRLSHRTVRNKDICRHFNLSGRNAPPGRKPSFLFPPAFFRFSFENEGRAISAFALFAVNGPTRYPARFLSLLRLERLSWFSLFFNRPLGFICEVGTRSLYSCERGRERERCVHIHTYRNEKLEVILTPTETP